MFLASKVSTLTLGPSYILFKGNGSPFPKAKLLGCESDISPPTIGKVLNVCNYISTPPLPIWLQGVVLQKKNKFTLAYTSMLNVQRLHLVKYRIHDERDFMDTVTNYMF
jgi:hypothetical protein